MVAIILMWGILGGCVNFIITMYLDKGDTLVIWITPKDVYDTTKMNWFGATMTYLIMYAISPVWYTLKLIWWLFHIGRK